MRRSDLQRKMRRQGCEVRLPHGAYLARRGGVAKKVMWSGIALSLLTYAQIKKLKP